jgi:methylenetetrahydrofolate dehydrogenase (NADP+)/methenyltetrahydrofolate cyclohydrolase
MICLRAKPLIEKTQEYLVKLRRSLNQAPRLDVLLIGNHEASAIYVGRKKQAAQDIGIDVVIHHISDHASQDHVEKLISMLNNESNCSGILLQLPLPAHFNVMKLLTLIDPAKDVDGFHPLNKGNHLDNFAAFVPCTALGVSRLLKFYNINLQSKNVLVLGRSAIVGKPLAIESLHQNATVTIAHSATKNLPDLVKQADIIMSATGHFGVIQWDQVHEHQIIIDVGIHRHNGDIVGDLGKKPAEKIVAAYTPVPGGVGAMTVNSLMYNIFKAYCLQKQSGCWADIAQSIDALTL